MRKVGMVTALACAAVALPAAALAGPVAQDRERPLVGVQTRLDRDSRRAYLGIMMGSVPAERARALGLDDAAGVLVSRVVLGGPADHAGIKNDDVIVSVDGRPVATQRDLQEALASRSAGDKVSVEVARDGGRQRLTVTLGEQPGLDFGVWQLPQGGVQIDPNQFGNFRLQFPSDLFNGQGAFDTVFAGARRVRLGVALLPLSEQLREYFGVDAGRGALVSSVVKGSAAERAGLRAGDVILSVDGNDVREVGDVSQALDDLTGTKTVQVEIVRDRARQTLSATIEAPDAANVE